MSRKEGGRQLASIEDSVYVSIQRLENDREKRSESMMSHQKNADNTKTKRATITGKQKREEKQLYGRFKRLISNISREKTGRG